MRTALGFILLACLLVSLSARADEVTARVRAIYYQAAGGVLVEPSLLRRPGAARWADIELADRRRALVQLPAGMEARIGDVVAVQLATPKSIDTAEPMRVSRVTEIKARDTQLAIPAR
jgi:hypothetical protein